MYIDMPYVRSVWVLRERDTSGERQNGWPRYIIPYGPSDYLMRRLPEVLTAGRLPPASVSEEVAGLRG